MEAAKKALRCKEPDKLNQIDGKNAKTKVQNLLIETFKLTNSILWKYTNQLIYSLTTEGRVDSMR